MQTARRRRSEDQTSRQLMMSSVIVAKELTLLHGRFHRKNSRHDIGCRYHCWASTMWLLWRALRDIAGTLAAVKLSSVQFILTIVNILRSNIDLVKSGKDANGRLLSSVFNANVCLSVLDVWDKTSFFGYHWKCACSQCACDKQRNC